MVKLNQDLTPLSTKQNLLWNSIGCFFYLGCQWLVTVVVVIFSQGFENSGILSFVMSTGVIFSAIGLYGVRPFQVSDLKGEFKSKNYIAFRLITVCAGYAICIVYSLFVSTSISVLVCSAIYLVFKADEALSDVFYGVYQINGRMDFIGVSQILRGFLSLGAFSVFIWATQNLAIAILAMYIGCLQVTIIYDVSHVRKFSSELPSIGKADVRKLGSVCFKSMLASAFIGLIVSAVRQYYGILEGNEMLGIYGAIATPAVVVQVAANYLYTPFLSQFAKARAESASQFLKLFFKVLSLLLLIILLGVAVLTPLGFWGLPLLYGTELSEHLYIFPFVLLATGSIALVYYFYNVLVTIRKINNSVMIAVVGFVVSLGLSPFLISSMGMNGVNISIIAGSMSAAFLGLFFVLKQASAAAQA